MRIAAVSLLLVCACGSSSGGDPADAATSIEVPPNNDRTVFLLPAGPSLFASPTAADDACAQAASDASLAGTSWHALLQFRSPEPTTHDRNPLTGVDRVVLPSGVVITIPRRS